MKRSEMNKLQLRAFEQVVFACDMMLGGYENAMDDGYLDKMPSHEELVEELYETVMNFTTYPGMQKNGGIDEVRFAGKEFIMERIENRLKKFGY